MLTWTGILQLGVFTACLTQLLGLAIDQFKRFLLRRTDARHLALRLAVMLEKFGIECADAISANDLYRSSGGHAGRQVCAIPRFPELPTDASWNILDTRLAARIAAMTNERMIGEGQIDFYWDALGEPDVMYGTTDNQCGKCGYRAWKIACDLRKRYELPQVDTRGLTWNFTKTLKQHHDYAMKLIDERMCEEDKDKVTTSVSA